MSATNQLAVLEKQEKEPAGSSCNLCGGTRSSLVSNVDRKNKPLRTVICQDCGLVFTDGNVISDLKDFYANQYRGDGPQPALKHICRHGYNALRRYDVLKKHLNPTQTVFDIGCGSGEFVYLLSYLGFKAKGIEPHHFANYGKAHLGLDLEMSFLEEFAASSPEKFDVVTIFHVLEHKEDPAETLSIIHSLLNDQGLCVVEVPNISAYCHTPKNLFHLDHLFNFNEKTLTLLGKKAGFDHVETIFSAFKGNITVIFRKSTAPNPEAMSFKAPDNYKRLFNKLKRYTTLMHYCTPTPYIRLIQKYFRYRQERQFAAQFTDGKVLLDALYHTHTQK